MVGRIVKQFEINDAYMCVNCTTMRWGDPQGACPSCGTQDVAVLELDGSSRGDGVVCDACGRRHDTDDADVVTHVGGRSQIPCECGNYLVECAYCDRYVSVMASASGPGGKPVHKECFKKEDC